MINTLKIILLEFLVELLKHKAGEKAAAANTITFQTVGLHVFARHDLYLLAAFAAGSCKAKCYDYCGIVCNLK